MKLFKQLSIATVVLLVLAMCDLTIAVYYIKHG